MRSKVRIQVQSRQTLPQLLRANYKYHACLVRHYGLLGVIMVYAHALHLWRLSRALPQVGDYVERDMVRLDAGRASVSRLDEIE